MFTAMMAAYPWDLVDEGLDEALERLGAGVGIRHLCLWAAAPAVSYLRARAVTPRWVHLGGGLTFLPDPPRYHASRIKPTVAAGLKAKDLFAAIAAACARTGLTLSAVISASRTGSMARRHPEFACKNAFGDVSETAVCLNHPDVRAWLCAVVEDLTTRYPVEWVELSDFVTSFAEAGALPLPVTAGADAVVRVLLGTCFCESCRHGAAEAGVPVESAARLAAVTIQQIVDRQGDNGMTLTDLRERHPPLADYADWTAAQLNQLLARLARAAARPLVLRRGFTPVETVQHATLDGSLTDGVILAADSLDSVSCVLEQCAATLGGPAAPAAAAAAPRVFLGAPGYAVASGFADRFVALVSQAAESGLAGVRIEDYHAWPAPAFDTLRRAVRFARRIGTEA